jgi:hypothetical protein
MRARLSYFGRCPKVSPKYRRVDETTKNSTAPQYHGGSLDRCTYWVAEIIGKIFVALTPNDERQVCSCCLSSNLRRSQMIQRAKEVEIKVKNAVSRSLGDRINNMLYIDALATEPASQGWGYGSALLDSIGALVCSSSYLSKNCIQPLCIASVIAHTLCHNREI